MMHSRANRPRQFAFATTTLAIMASSLCLSVTPCISYADSSAADNAAPATSVSSVSSVSSPALLTADQLVLLEKLDDADYMTRDLTMTSLLTDDTLAPSTLDAMYAHATSDEQRVRLRQVAVHHTARLISLKYKTQTDSAVLGMSPASLYNLPDDAEAASPAILVRWTFPGSVAFAHLRQGDIITQVNGKPMPATANGAQVTATFIQLISSCRAGDAMSFHVIRDGHELDINLKLGSDRALQAIYQSARTAQSREFNADVAQQIDARLKVLDQLAPETAELKLTLPAADDAADAANAAQPTLQLDEQTRRQRALQEVIDGLNNAAKQVPQPMPVMDQNTQ